MSGRQPQRGAGPAGLAAHHLYILAGEADAASRRLTLIVLRYVRDNLAVFTSMGVRVQVHRVRRADLANPRLVEAMKRRGIGSLPALVTPNKTYVGNSAIIGLYAQNIAALRAGRGEGGKAGKSGKAGGGGGGKNPPIDDEDDELAAFYGEEMTFSKAGADDSLDDEAIGENGSGMDMMGAYQARMRTREKADASPAGGAGPGPGGGGAGGARRDNVAADEESISALVGRMAGGRADSAEAAGGPGGLGGGGAPGEEDDEGGDTPQDLMMEQAFWENQELST